jgi:hypothetical protein
MNEATGHVENGETAEPGNQQDYEQDRPDTHTIVPPNFMNVVVASTN